MIRMAKHINIPHEVTIACSGGVDSMAVVDFLRNGGRTVHAAYFNHGTEFGERSELFLLDYFKVKDIKLTLGKITKDKPAGKSPEEHWRDERYKFLDSLGETVVAAHHLDDVIETWIFSALHGTPKLIPWTRNNVIRPFLLTKKEELIRWCIRSGHLVPHLEDPSNKDTKYMRNFIRHELVPKALRVNPGLHKVLYKKLVSGDTIKDLHRG